MFADAATVFDEEEVRPMALADAAAFSTDAEAVEARLRFSQSFLPPFRLREGDFELSVFGSSFGTRGASEAARARLRFLSVRKGLIQPRG